MSNVAKYCGCRQCRDGIRRSHGKCTAKRAAKKFRKSSKQALAKGVEPPKTYSVPYTD